MIDAHHHLWDLAAVEYPWLAAKGTPRFFGDPTPIQKTYGFDDFFADSVGHGATGSVHIQVGAADPLVEARWVQAVAEAQQDWRMAQVAFCDLTSADRSANLDELQRMSTVRGVRQIVGRAPGEDAETGTQDLLDNSEFLSGLQELGERGLSFDLQLIPELMDRMAQLLAQAPNTAVALCHAGSPHDRTVMGLSEWAKTLRALSDLPQVYCKISGLGMFQHHWEVADFKPIIQTCLDQFGAERCMFGSNFPVDSLYSDYDRLFEAHMACVPVSDHAAVFGETATQFYQL
ncbi:amidohydrolase family protein [Phaeobacter sp.]|uniref:amidohydrolase family protein n=1 Tax=Phaeobacter sp. TaxID=1902409 RepID=UPI0025E82460|nr:amidohydrolase family protein [Phaeobacter sp.]